MILDENEKNTLSSPTCKEVFESKISNRVIETLQLLVMEGIIIAFFLHDSLGKMRRTGM
jgi:hypothetical protein